MLDLIDQTYRREQKILEIEMKEEIEEKREEQCEYMRVHDCLKKIIKEKKEDMKSLLSFYHKKYKLPFVKALLLARDGEELETLV